MTNIDWEQAKVEFVEKLLKRFPATAKLIQDIGAQYKEIWKEVRPFAGIEDKIEISIDKNYNLTTSLSGWVLLGTIAITGVNKALEELSKSPHFQELNEKVKGLERELKELKARVKNVEEYKEIA